MNKSVSFRYEGKISEEWNEVQRSLKEYSRENQWRMEWSTKEFKGVQ